MIIDCAEESSLPAKRDEEEKKEEKTKKRFLQSSGIEQQQQHSGRFIRRTRAADPIDHVRTDEHDESRRFQ